MKWKRGQGNDRNVIDIRGSKRRRGSGGGMGGIGGLGGGGGGGRLPMPGGKGKVGGVVAVVIVLIVIGTQFLGGGSGSGTGFDMGSMFPGMGSVPGAENPAPIPAGQDPDRDLKEFSSYVFNDAQDVWSRAFRKDDRPWRDAQLVLYSDAVSTGGCGNASSAVGPFYCPADHRVYLDLSFYRQMERQLDAGGDFAWAYVIAHEMGHHVQNLGGISDQVARAKREQSESRNEISVRNELQADCLAGVWASTVFDQLEPGDLDEAIGASEAVGDDRLQSQGGGNVNPDSFTHGTSAQRHHWFQAGFESGDPAQCDTFSGDV
ncbi:MAG: neutral zinc metallopeptidase [Solirubrobacterales bacterium]|nr:neutral zinc metallopeptidase [Solirubrobacterales bacterium]